jgi:hypothetical protein
LVPALHNVATAIRADIRGSREARQCTCMPTHIYTYTLTHTQTHTHAHTHTRKHVHMYMYTHRFEQ